MRVVCAALGCAGAWLPALALAYPHMPLRMADQVIGGPTDSTLASVHYNPAALRLSSGSQFLAVAGVRGLLGSYTAAQPTPTGFSPTGEQGLLNTNFSSLTPEMLVAASWDVRSEAVTLGIALYSPMGDQTRLASDEEIAAQGARLGTLGPRYHGIVERTYSVSGIVAAGLRIRPQFYFGGGFQVYYLRSRMTLMTDQQPTADSDGLPCSTVDGACQQWANRTLLSLDTRGWAYGFNLGVLYVPIEHRLWIGASYTSAPLTAQGTVVNLDGAPTDASWLGRSAEAPCGDGGLGATIQPGGEASRCGTARIARGFPHLLYVGIRGRLRRSRPASQGTPVVTDDRDEQPRDRAGLHHIELAGWLRLTMPTHPDTVISIGHDVLPTGDVRQPRQLRTAVAVALGVRQVWRRVTLAQELLYESPKSDGAAVSPMNVAGHSLDLSLAGHLRVMSRLALVFTVGVTATLTEAGAGEGYRTDWAGACRQSQFDILSEGCRRAQAGWALPSAAGSYQLFTPHGIAGLLVTL